jgi:hypothetical protein
LALLAIQNDKSPLPCLMSETKPMKLELQALNRSDSSYLSADSPGETLDLLNRVPRRLLFDAHLVAQRARAERPGQDPSS